MLQVFVTWFHVIAAMFWIGGTLFFSIVLIPSLSGSELPEKQKLELISRIGKRFRFCGWHSLGALVLTGALRLYMNGIPLSSYGTSLFFKLFLVVVVVLLTLIHDFILGPKSIALSRQRQGPHALQKTVRWVARLNLVLGLLVVLAAVFLVHGY